MQRGRKSETSGKWKRVGKLGKPDRMFRGDKSLTKNKVRMLNRTREEGSKERGEKK